MRYAGYTLMGVLCTHQMGTEAMLAECKSVMPAGLWSLCMQTLLNNQECGIVRGKVSISPSTAAYQVFMYDCGLLFLGW